MSKRWFLIGVTSLALTGLGCNNIHHEGKEKDEHEVKVSINEVPAAVRATLEQAANGAKITTVDKEEKHGKTVYEADAVINGENYEIVVGEDGKLISKKLDKEEDEKSEGKK